MHCENKDKENKQQRSGIKMYFKDPVQYGKDGYQAIEVKKDIYEDINGDRQPAMKYSQGAIIKNKLLSEHEVVFMGQVDGDVPGAIQSTPRHLEENERKEHRYEKKQKKVLEADDGFFVDYHPGGLYSK
ncbi:MAG TPA: hypothetical protein VNW04_12765 [Puia sp.]|nr:hypothetical protein [Puia sp.]